MDVDRDVKKLRIIAICGVVGSFVFALVALIVFAKKYHLSGGNYFPLLSQMNPVSVTCDNDKLNSFVGRLVSIRCRVFKVDKMGDGYVVQIGKVVFLLDKKKVEWLQSKYGFSINYLVGKDVEVIGRLVKHKVYGFQLILPNSNFIKIREGGAR